MEEEKSKLVPAFESSIGLAPKTAIMVPEDELEKVNKEVAPVSRYAMKSANIASLYATRAVRPDEIAALRRAMFTVVYSNLGEVEKVVQGKKSWTASQVRLYALLTERVIPKMQSIALEDNTNKKVEDLSIEELEALALGRKKQIQDQLNTIDVQAEEIKEYESKIETRDAKREVLRELANIEAMDEAERKYVARLVGTKPEVEAELEEKRRDKFQPPPTPEILAKVRQKNGRSLEQRWRDAGYSEEEIKQKLKEASEKRKATRAKTMERKKQALGLNLGLTSSQKKIAEDIREAKNKALRDFRVNPLKGRRNKSVVQREIEEKQRKEEERREKELNPRIYTSGKTFGIEEDIRGIRLQEFKEKYPEVFVVTEEDKETLREIDRAGHARQREKERLRNATRSGEISSEDSEGIDQVQ